MVLTAAAGQDVSRLVLQVLAVFLGGSSVQLIVRLLTRRSELRKTSTESDSVVVTAANNQVIRIEAELQRAIARIDELERDLTEERERADRALTAMETRHAETMRMDHVGADALLNGFREENVRLNKMVSKMQLDLARAQTKIRVLEARFAVEG